MKITDTHMLVQVLEAAIGSPITSFERVVDPGEVNDVFMVNTNRARLIARLNDRSELSRFEKEKWCIEKASAVGVKVPQVIAIGTTENYAYLIESYVQGTRADAAIDQSSVWSSAGQYAKALHDVEVSGFGENLDEITGSKRDDWTNYLKSNLQTLSAQEEVFVKASGLSASEIQTMQQWLKGLEDKDLRFGLSHGDLSLKNMIVDESGEVNLIDWGAAEAHIVPHYDLGVILEDSLHDNSEYIHRFLEGYGMSYDEFLVIEPDIATIMLLIAVDKLRWALDKRPELVGAMSSQLRSQYDARNSL